MHFIEQIENKKRQYIEENGIIKENKFYYYMDIMIDDKIDVLLSQEFKLLKRGFTTQIIMVDKSSGIKTYLSDFDIIISLLEVCKRHVNIVKEVLKDMVEIIEGNGEEFKFSIETYKYNVKGIPLKESTSILVDVYTDTTINLNDLIVLINLVTEKERYSTKPLNLEGTLVKFIILTICYGNICDAEVRNQISLVLATYDINIDRSLYKNKEKITTKKDYKLLISYQSVVEIIKQIE